MKNDSNVPFSKTLSFDVAIILPDNSKFAQAEGPGFKIFISV